MNAPTITRPAPPAWVTHVDSSGNGVGVTLPVHTIEDTSVLVEWTPDEGAIIWINEDRYTRPELVAANAARLAVVEAANARAEATVDLPEWDDEPLTLTLVQAIDLVATMSLAVAITGNDDRTAEQTLIECIALVRS